MADHHLCQSGPTCLRGRQEGVGRCRAGSEVLAGRHSLQQTETHTAQACLRHCTFSAEQVMPVLATVMQLQAVLAGPILIS